MHINEIEMQIFLLHALSTDVISRFPKIARGGYVISIFRIKRSGVNFLKEHQNVSFENILPVSEIDNCRLG